MKRGWRGICRRRSPSQQDTSNQKWVFTLELSSQHFPKKKWIQTRTLRHRKHHHRRYCIQQWPPLSYLLGTWRGQGEGGYPTIHSFSYGEELHFSHPPNKPVIGYTQKTWKLSSGEPMHAESGYWRPKPDGTIEVVIAQSTGLVEVQKGTYSTKDKVIQLQSEIVGNASKVKEIRRCFQLVDGNLCYDVQMATHTITLQPHLKASLKKL